MQRIFTILAPFLHHFCTNVDQNILELILQNPNISVKQLSEALGLSERSVKTRMTLLKKEGKITRVGNNRTGYWKVVG